MLVGARIVTLGLLVRMALHDFWLQELRLPGIEELVLIKTILVGIVSIVNRIRMALWVSSFLLMIVWAPLWVVLTFTISYFLIFASCPSFLDHLADAYDVTDYFYNDEDEVDEEGEDDDSKERVAHIVSRLICVEQWSQPEHQTEADHNDALIHYFLDKSPSAVEGSDCQEVDDEQDFHSNHDGQLGHWLLSHQSYHKRHYYLRKQKQHHIAVGQEEDFALCEDEAELPFEEEELMLVLEENNHTEQEEREDQQNVPQSHQQVKDIVTWWGEVSTTEVDDWEEEEGQKEQLQEQDQQVEARPLASILIFNVLHILFRFAGVRIVHALEDNEFDQEVYEDADEEQEVYDHQTGQIVKDKATV